MKNSETELFYKLLAHSPYRKLMIIEAFWYKAQWHEKSAKKDSEAAFLALLQLLDILENIGELGYTETEYWGKNNILKFIYLGMPISIDFIEAEILKYFYTVLLESSKTQDEFITVVKRVKNHIFRRNLMYNSDLRKYIFELAVNQELLYIRNHMNDFDEKQNIKKLTKNIDSFIHRIAIQLQDFPNALNILKNYEIFINNYENSDDFEEKIVIYQKLVLELIKNVSYFIKFLNIRILLKNSQI